MLFVYLPYQIQIKFYLILTRSGNFSVQNEQRCQEIPNCSNFKLVMTNLPKFQRKFKVI